MSGRRRLTCPYSPPTRPHGGVLASRAAHYHRSPQDSPILEVGRSEGVGPRVKERPMEEDQQQRAVLAIFAQMVYSSCCNTAHPCHHTGVKAIWVLCVTGTLRAIMTPTCPCFDSCRSWQQSSWLGGHRRRRGRRQSGEEVGDDLHGAGARVHAELPAVLVKRGAARDL